MSGVEGALSRRTPRPQAAAARAAAGHGGPPNELKTQCSTCVRLARPAQRVRGRPQAAAARRPRQRWPPPQSGHPAAGRPHVAAAGRPQAVAAGRPQGGRRRTATAGRPQAATAGRPQAAAVRAAAGRAWATRIACLLRVGDENSMLAAERRDRESAEFGEMKREAGGLGEFLLCPQGKANKKKLTGWPQAAAGHRNPALGLSPPY